MCLVSEQKVPKVAKRNIYSYKVVYKDAIAENYRSYCENFRYILGQTYKIELRIDKYDNDCFADSRAINRFHKKIRNGAKLFTVSDGFHSYSTIKRIQELWLTKDLYIVLCMIPKGSEYIKDGDSLIVSNQIIILNEISRAEKILKP
jgi:hypothetical protein